MTVVATSSTADGSGRAALTHPLPDDLVELIAERFRALAEPTRIKLLDRLRDGEATVLELTVLVGTTQQNVSKHLNLLRGPASSPGASKATTSTTGSPTRPSTHSAKPSAAACETASTRFTGSKQRSPRLSDKSRQAILG